MAREASLIVVTLRSAQSSLTRCGCLNLPPVASIVF
jgi:hypothetical protein